MLGLVGESGSGKTTLGRALLGLVRPTGGQREAARRGARRAPGAPAAAQAPAPADGLPGPARVAEPGHDARDRARAPAADPQADQGRRRDPGQGPRDAGARRASSPVEQFADGFPADLSGGQKQRAAIARAIITGPDLVVADEPVSMLDMSVRAKILDLMIDLKHRLGLTYVYVTHDLATAQVLLRPRGDHVPRPDRRDRDGRPDLRRAQAPVHAGADPGDPGAGPGQGAPARPAARRDPRRGARRRWAARSTRAARRRSRSAAGSRATCARSSRSAGCTAARSSTTPSARWSATSKSSTSAEHDALVPAGLGQGSRRPAGDARADPRRSSRTSRCGRA